jgi:hypothetical protein
MPAFSGSVLEGFSRVRRRKTHPYGSLPGPYPGKMKGGSVSAPKILGETTLISLDHTHFRHCGSITKVLPRHQHLHSVVLAGYCLSPASGLSRLGPAPAFLSAISCMQRACNHCALTRISVKGGLIEPPEPPLGTGLLTIKGALLISAYGTL